MSNVEQWKRHEWVRLDHRGRTVVLGTPRSLAKTRAVWCAGGLAVAYPIVAVTLYVAGLTTAAYAMAGAMLLLALVLWCAGAPAAADRRRLDGYRPVEPSYGPAPRSSRGPRFPEEQSDDEVPRTQWGAMSRQQPALPQRGRGLPSSSRRALQ